MRRLIKKMNEMFAVNPYTDDGRVTVDYAPNCNCVVIKVCERTRMINVEEYTMYGIMNVIMDNVREMYDKL